jgi:hypothetical protein
MSKPIVIIGPWIGEFGPEIESWVPRLRSFRQKHPDLYIVIPGYPGRNVLYEFADEYWPLPDFFVNLLITRIYNTIFDVLLDSRTHQVVTFDHPDLQTLIQWLRTEARARFGDSELHFLQPTFNLASSQYCLDDTSIHRKIRTTGKSAWDNHVIIFTRDRFNESWRNWPIGHWHELTTLLLRDNQKVVLCGNIADSAAINITHCNFMNTLGASLEDQVTYIQDAQLALTSMSGAWRLAAYIGCPTVTWGDLNHLDNIARHEPKPFASNPFGTPLYFLGQRNRWDYSPAEVFDFAKQYLKRSL